MSEEGSAGEATGPAVPAGPAGGGDGIVRHPHAFKLRFSARREPGRSHVSALRPLGLPAALTDKPHAQPPAPHEPDAAAELRVRRKFLLAPRDLYPAPLTTAHEYGWWWREARPGVTAQAGMRHAVRDSPWMKGRLLVLAADARRD